MTKLTTILDMKLETEGSVCWILFPDLLSVFVFSVECFFEEQTSARFACKKAVKAISFASATISGHIHEN